MSSGLLNGILFCLTIIGGFAVFGAAVTFVTIKIMDHTPKGTVKKMDELEEEFKLKDFSKEEYKCKEFDMYEGLNPYYLIALWYYRYCRDAGNCDFNSSVDITYNTINEMKRSGYGDDVIAESLMMEMAEFYDCKSRFDEIKNNMVSERTNLINEERNVRRKRLKVK